MISSVTAYSTSAHSPEAEVCSDKLFEVVLHNFSPFKKISGRPWYSLPVNIIRLSANNYAEQWLNFEMENISEKFAHKVMHMQQSHMHIISIMV